MGCAATLKSADKDSITVKGAETIKIDITTDFRLNFRRKYPVLL